MKTLWRLLTDERGTETVEWAIVIGLIAMGAITAAILIGGHVTRAFDGLELGLQSIP